jgi:hypothetical protein
MSTTKAPTEPTPAAAAKAASEPETETTAPDLTARDVLRQFKGVRVQAGAKDGKPVMVALKAEHILDISHKGTTVRILTLDGVRHEVEAGA